MSTEPSYLGKWIKAGYTVYWGTVGFSLRINWRGKKTTIFDAYPDTASIIRTEKAHQLGLPEEIYATYRRALMESPMISGAITSGRTYLRFDNMSIEDVSLLLQSTDNLAQSLISSA